MIPADMKSLLRQYGPSVLSGILLALAFPKWSLYPMAWVALTPLLAQAHTWKARQAFGYFLLAGWVFNALLLYWLATNLYWAGGWAFWGYQLLCIILAFFWGLAGMAWVWVRNRVPPAGNAISFALLWTSMEFLQAHLFSGFGWGAVAYSQGGDLPVLQLAAVGGAPLISGVVAACNAWFAAAIDGWRQGGDRRGMAIARPLAAAAVLVTVAHGIGFWMLGTPDYTARRLSVGLFQSNFPLEMKWDREYTAEMVRNAAQKSRWLARHKKVDLFVWPEALIMENIDIPDIWAEVAGLVKDTGASVLTGAGHEDKATSGTPNSCCLVDPSANVVAWYDKVHLVPFGEYVPFGNYLPFIQQVVPAIGDVAFGREQKIMKTANRALGPLICFEVLYADMAERLRRMGADCLVVITNLGWFGMSAAIPQELELARMRAVETRLAVIHCANTGISGTFDPWGRFTLLAGAIGPSGQYADYTGRITPEDTIMQRMTGALPVSAPGTRPIPYGPMAFPRLALGASALLLAWAALKGTRIASKPARGRARTKSRS